MYRGLKIATVTPTRGDRPDFMEKCKQYIMEQTVPPDEIFIINYPPNDPGKSDICERYRRGFEEAFNAGADIIFCMEDDDWYYRGTKNLKPNDPEYKKGFIEQMVDRFIESGRPRMIGLNYNLYYHIGINGVSLRDHTGYSSMAFTGFSKDFPMEYWDQVTDSNFDVKLWRLVTGELFAPPAPIAIGIKHNTGMCGGKGFGHKPAGYPELDPDWSKLLKLTRDQDAVEFYKRWQRGPSTTGDQVPLIILNHNQLYCTVNLINWWNYITGYWPVYIVDSASDYQPLLEFYNQCGAGIFKNVTVKRYSENACRKNMQEFVKGVQEKYYILTNPDIAPRLSVPENFIEIYKYCIEELKYQRVGFCLDLEIPEHANEREKILAWEGQFYNNPQTINYKGQSYIGYKAQIDLTFAMYKNTGSWENTRKDRQTWTNSLRLFNAAHIPWYIHPETKIDENINYFGKCLNANAVRGKDGTGINHWNPLKPLPEYFNTATISRELKTRTDLINHIISVNGYASYLEIGVRNPRDNFNKIQCQDKIGVDPAAQASFILPITSDKFFEQNKRNYDIIFIDGLHHADQVYRDIINALDALSAGGTIVMHDCNPQTEQEQIVPIKKGTMQWTGDTWKAYVQARADLSFIETMVINIDHGCGIIRRAPTNNRLKINEQLTYESLEKNRQHWLTLMRPEDFIRNGKAKAPAAQ